MTGSDSRVRERPDNNCNHTYPSSYASFALGSQILQQSFCTSDAAHEPLCVTPFAGWALRKAIHADVDHKIAQIGILLLQCPLLKWVQGRLTGM